ncbi:MAG: PQQ-dependent sugar dehydrogenase, partial [Verrucomicrobiota bacterium]
MFIAQRWGEITVLTNLPGTAKETFLDFEDKVTMNGESGLLGLAFHPNYAANGYFYIFYSFFDDGDLFQRVSRMSVSASDPNEADPSSEVPMITQEDDMNNHNGGDLHFGPDRYLYISVGDEGGANDSHNNAPFIDKDFFGGILRIDVDRNPAVRPFLEPNPHIAVMTNGAGEAFYGIPPDNAWVGATQFRGVAVSPTAVHTEFWSVGLRNPWRMSFDPLTDELWIGDVGQNAREEIDIGFNGADFGWAIREGFIGGPAPNPMGLSFAEPVWHYVRTEGRSITGGLVYRGANIPQLYGTYIYADYITGNIWGLNTGPGFTNNTLLLVENQITAFGLDPRNGDVLMADDDGNLRRLVANPASGGGEGFPPSLSESGVFANPTNLTVNPGWVAYAPNVDFWSDYAVKSRWFTIPDLTNTIGFARDGNWNFPDCMIWMKHFDLEMIRGIPGSSRRVETRFLIKNGPEVFGLSYQWRPDQTDADLVGAGGTNQNVIIDLGGGIMHTQTWIFPSRVDCLQCHTEVGGSALSFNTRQLNRDYSIFGSNQNQIVALQDAGYLSGVTSNHYLLPWLAPADDTGQSLEFRARSYLAANCVQCHQPGGVGPTSFDVRPEITMNQTRLIDGVAANDGGNPSHRLVVPGSTNQSILLHRIQGCCGFTRMPALASTELDTENIQLIIDWIGSPEIQAVRTYNQWQVAEFGSSNAPGADRGEDWDMDGSSNEEEWLTGTSPTNDLDFWVMNISVTGNMATLSFPRTANTGFEAEYSLDLETWWPWNVPGNRPVFTSPTRADSISGDTGPFDLLYFRMKIY